VALLTSELRRLRYELGYNVLDAGAEPYIGVHAVFEQVIQTYMQAGATTTSATAVTAATTPTPVTLTLADGTGFTAFDRAMVDVDGRLEVATIQLVSGNDITLMLELAHSGTYPVAVEGGEAIVRQILRRLDLIAAELGDGGVLASAGLRRVDEIEFANDLRSSRREETEALREYWRDELASALGVRNLRSVRGSSNSVSLY
jgi:hypothetical protein